MRQILLAGTYYQLAPGTDISKRTLNPWKAKLGSSGVREFSDFGETEFEEYHDLRNGIGLESALPNAGDRLYWSEGVDVATPRSSVLGPLVNTADYKAWEAETVYALLNFRIPTTTDGYVYECTTAGTSGASEPSWDDTPGNTTNDGTAVWTCREYLATVKIIDFQSNTYFIQDERILKWNSTYLDGVDNSLADPIDALIITDDTDEYLIVSSATESIYTTDGSTWTSFAWISPTSHTDDDGNWANEANAYDDDTSTKTTNDVDGHYLQLITEDNVYTNKCRFWINVGEGAVDFDVDFYYDEGWVNIFSGSASENQWVTKTNSAGYKNVEKARVKFNGGTTLELFEFQFGNALCGYLADYQNRLYAIATDGRYVHYSAERDIDDFAGQLKLTGNFGSLFGLFQGKLLSDGTPAIYFHGTRGLFSVDITNEIAYQQEISYPPLDYAGHAGMYWNANLWVATGYGILKIAPSLATHVGPDQDDGLPSGYHGYIYDMESVNNWLVYCVNGGTSDKSSIIKRNATVGGNQQVYTTSATNKAIPCIHHSPSSQYTNGRLWFGEDTGIKYMMFPDVTSNVKQIATYEYVATSSYCKLPIFRKLAVISKTALGVAAVTAECDTNEYATIYYGLNGAAPTTELGTLKTSPRPTLLTFGSGLGLEFYRIQLAFKLQRGSTTTNSPQLESLIFYYIPTPVSIHSWAFNILAIEDDAEEIITAFETLRDTNTLVAFYPTGDPNKTSYNVKVADMPIRFVVENQQTRQGSITIVVQELFKG